MTTDANAAAIAGLQPAPVWRFFAELASVPRPSKHEEKIRAAVRALAERLKLPAREDEVGNIVLTIPATPGHEHAAPTVLQGHLDMVAEKNAGTEHDFLNDPIKLAQETESQSGRRFMHALGTTLGADNGIGVALSFAAATEPGVVHGPLEILLTIDEEMGMTGAKALTPDFFQGKRLLNLDSEEDDALYIGCAGGLDTTLIWDLKAGAVPARAEVCRVSVAGLRGGHSGCDIHLNRGSAIKLLVQALRSAGQKQLRLASIAAGSKRNVIPREASALVVGPVGTESRLRAAAEQVEAESTRAFGEANCSIQVARWSGAAVGGAAAPKDTARLLDALAALPHGVLAVVPEIPGLVQTSNSVSTIESTRADGTLKVTVGCLSRSSSTVQLQATAAQIAAVGTLACANVEHGNGYPGWQPNVNSPLLATCKRLYEQLFEAVPRVAAIHAGLECGIIGERMGGDVDMISFGPQITGAHSPDERVCVESVEKIWTYLKAVLAELAKS